MEVFAYRGPWGGGWGEPLWLNLHMCTFSIQMNEFFYILVVLMKIWWFSSFLKSFENMSDEQPWEEGSHWAETETCIQPVYRTSPGKNEFKAAGNESVLNANALTFEPTENRTGPSIGQDLWRQLKRVQIPVFSGDKRTYQSWKAAFLACIDSAPATGEYTLYSELNSSCVWHRRDVSTHWNHSIW